MSEHWKVNLFSLKDGTCNCLLGCFLGYLGVGIVQAKAFSHLDKPKALPILRSALCCCIGAGINRSNVRKYYKIRGNALLDCGLYLLPLCCVAPNQEVQEVFQRQKEERTKKPMGHFPGGLMPIPPPAPVPAPVPVLGPPDPTIHNSPFNQEYDSFSEGTIQTISEGVFAGNLHYASSKRSVESILISEPDGPDEPAIMIEPERETQQSEEPYAAVKELAIEPLDGNDPEIYSHVVGTPPLSYVLGEEHRPDCPPPTYLTLEYLQTPKTTDHTVILEGMEALKDGRLLCVDQDALSRQKGVVKDVVGQVLSNITKGLGAVSVSLPIRIFEPRSSAERMIDRFAYAPTYLTTAATSTDKVQRIAYLMCCSISGLYLGSRQEKPFNPLLGETFEGKFPDGSSIYVEHTVHNPPTDCFDIIGNGYRLWGFTELDGGFNWNYNELLGEFRGRFNIYFPIDGQMICFTQPKFRVCGTLFGDRTLNWEGEFDFKDFANGLYGAIRIGDDKKKWGYKKKMHKANFIGKIWDYDFEKDKPIRALATVRGSWLKHFTLERDGVKQRLWQLGRDPPHRQFPVNLPLPSDFRYREDLIWLSKGNLEYASKWKARVEARQRNDRVLRGKH